MVLVDAAAGKTCAVIGAAGFLGRAFVEAAKQEKLHTQLFTRARPAVSSGRMAPDLRADVIFWLATQINPQIAETNPELVAEDRGHFREFLAVLDSAHIAPRVVLISSGGTVYDDRLDPPYTEDDAVHPTSSYGQAKLALEEDLSALYRGPRTILRVANAYGPGQPVGSGQGVIAHWLRAARRGENLRLIGDPSSTRDYVFVDDIARAMIAIVYADSKLPRVVNIGSGRPTSLATLARQVLTIAGDDALNVTTHPARSFDAHHNYLNISLAQQCLGWNPSIPLEEGLRIAWNAVRQLGDPTP